VQAIIDLGEGAIEVPGEGKAAVFVLLEPLEFLDEVKLKFNRNPRGKFKSNVAVSESATIAASSGNNPNGEGFLDPLFWGEGEAI
jgi:hypothetical protein